MNDRTKRGKGEKEKENTRREKEGVRKDAETWLLTLSVALQVWRRKVRCHVRVRVRVCTCGGEERCESMGEEGCEEKKRGEERSEELRWNEKRREARGNTDPRMNRIHHQTQTQNPHQNSLTINQSFQQQHESLPPTHFLHHPKVNSNRLLNEYLSFSLSLADTSPALSLRRG